VVPVLMGVGYSFTTWTISDARFYGLGNYIRLLTQPDVNTTFYTTLVFTVVSTALKVTLGLLLALFLNKKFVLNNTLRTIFYMPCIINSVGVGIIFIALMHPTTGLINSGLRALGLHFMALSWLADPNIAIYSVAMVEVWKWTGFTMMIFLAGLQTVPAEYYEAAELDGSSPFQKFWHVTFPLIMPVFNNALILNLIGGLKIFDIVLATTGGGPGRATQVMNIFIYKSFSSGRFGEGTAGNVLLTIIVALIAIPIYLRIRKSEVDV